MRMFTLGVAMLVFMLHANITQTFQLIPIHTKLDAIIHGEAMKYESVTPDLVNAIISVESDYNKNALSIKDCKGLMQVSDGALTDYNKDKETSFIPSDLFEPSINIAIGVWYLSEKCIKKHGMNKVGISSFNQGPYSTNMRYWYYGKVKKALEGR